MGGAANRGVEVWKGGDQLLHPEPAIGALKKSTTAKTSYMAMTRLRLRA